MAVGATESLEYVHEIHFEFRHLSIIFISMEMEIGLLIDKIWALDLPSLKFRATLNVDFLISHASTSNVV